MPYYLKNINSFGKSWAKLLEQSFKNYFIKIEVKTLYDQNNNNIMQIITWK